MWIGTGEGIALVAFNVLVVLIWKPWAGAYAGEKGKNFARKEDLDAVLNEVRAVAMTQREIEAKSLVNFGIARCTGLKRRMCAAK